MKRYSNSNWAENVGPGARPFGKRGGPTSAQYRGAWSATVTHAQIDVYPGYHLLVIFDVDSGQILKTALDTSPCLDRVIPKLDRLAACRGAPHSVSLKMGPLLHTEALLAWCQCRGVKLCLPPTVEAARRSSCEEALS